VLARVAVHGLVRQCHDGGRTERPTVSYQVNDLTNAQGVERSTGTCSHRHEVCARYDAHGISTACAHQLCFDAALTTAVAKVDAPLLTQRHAGETEALLRTGARRR
jgi:hypothetical protein